MGHVQKLCKCRFVSKSVTGFFPSFERVNFVYLRISTCPKPIEIDVDADSEKPICTLPPDDVCKPDRVIPQSDQLADRFDLVHRIYGHLLDAKTKQHLLRAEAWEAWEAVKRLRVHIRAGCLSDPPGVALYFEAGKDSATGCSLFRCVRGTNDLEGCHLRMRLLAAWCISPLLGHLLLLEYNYRWNLRQAVNNRGLDSSVGGFHDQPVLEAVQVGCSQNERVVA